jgi:hypothetical protein
MSFRWVDGNRSGYFANSSTGLAPPCTTQNTSIWKSTTPVARVIFRLKPALGWARAGPELAEGPEATSHKTLSRGFRLQAEGCSGAKVVIQVLDAPSKALRR